MKSFVLAFCVAIGIPGCGWAAEQPVLVELFTSQGCSSCPPAEQVLLDLAERRPDVLALGYHVDYWDRLGWKDVYSSPAATQRQRRYQSLLGTSNVYTPQIVVGGRSDVIGSDGEAVSAAIAANRTGRAVPVTISRAGDVLQISIGAGPGSGKVVLVGFDRRQETAIRRGENAGRSVRQANVVRSIAELGDWQGTELTLSRPVPAGDGFALILQAPNGRVLATAQL